MTLRFAALLLLLVLAAGCTVEQQVRWAFAHEGAPPVVQDQAVDVAHCESRLNPAARNGRHLGLFQLRWDYHGEPWADPFNPVANAMIAARLQAEQGWRPWACRP